MRILALLLILLSQPVFAERKINIVLPFNYAGTSGQVAAILRSSLEQDGNAANVILKAGAAGIVGTNYLAESKPDGSTIGVVTTAGVFPTEHKESVKYTADSFTFLTSMGKQTFVVISSIGSIEDFILAVSGKAQSTFGATSAGQFNALRLIKKGTDKNFIFITYKDPPQLLSDLASSRIAYSISTPAAANPMIQSGKIRPVAVTSVDRLTHLPGTPALSEYFAGYEYASHVFIAAPAGLSDPDKTWLVAALRKFAARSATKLADFPLYLHPYAFGPEHAIRAIADDGRKYKQ
jgi:tripartite-type tricarboxylate transporter receptor subunit TctC